MAKVTALQWHTYNGKAYDVGATYEAPDDLIDSLVVQGKAAPADPAGVAKAKAKAAAKPASRQARRVKTLSKKR